MNSEREMLKDLDASVETMNAVPLKEHFEKILLERERALELFGHSLEKRLDILNNLRAEVLTDRSQFMTKEVYDKMHQITLLRIEALERFQSKLIGIGIVVMVIAGVIGAVIERLLKP